MLYKTRIIMAGLIKFNIVGLDFYSLLVLSLRLKDQSFEFFS